MGGPGVHQMSKRWGYFDIIVNEPVKPGITAGRDHSTIGFISSFSIRLSSGLINSINSPMV
jgi:hypothetical protein